MYNVTRQACVSTELKQEAQAVFSAIRNSTAEAIHVSLQHAVNSGGLPFPPSAKTPNAQTPAALVE